MKRRRGYRSNRYFPSCTLHPPLQSLYHFISFYSLLATISFPFSCVKDVLITRLFFREHFRRIFYLRNRLEMLLHLPEESPEYQRWKHCSRIIIFLQGNKRSWIHRYSVKNCISMFLHVDLFICHICKNVTIYNIYL